MAEQTVEFTVTSYNTNRKGDVISNTAINHTALTPAIELKKKDSTGVMVFVTANSTMLADVQSFVEKQGMSLYKTKKDSTYVLGLERKPIVVCSLV
jgi:hypothetical protein